MPQRKNNNLRNEMRSVVSNLDTRWLRVASVELCHQLEELTQKRINRPIKHILAWTSFFAGEADLSTFIADQLELKTIYLPQTLQDMRMRFISIGREWDENIEEGFYGIPEPKDQAGELFDLDSAHETIVLVPGLVFDKQGNRLGRGKGYYDRFLAQSGMEEAIKIGICWSLQFIDHLQPQSHDMPVDWICHERGYSAAER